MGRGKANVTQVAKYPLDMADAELRATFGSLPIADMMRSLIMAEVDAIRAGAPRENRTMRNLWYDFIKPVLSRAGRLGDLTSGGKPVDFDDKLSKYLAELVRDGRTSYHELRIIDGSRQRQVATSVTQTIHDVTLVGAHYPWLILFTEKDTLWNEVESLATLYGVSAISGGGQPSFACTENTVRAIRRRESRAEHYIVILSLTDYDPFGYYIAESQVDQVVDIVGAGNVMHVRLGLEPGQLTPQERQAKAYTPKDKGFDEWYTKTGGVDGEPLGLELDALPLSRLRTMFADGIESCIDIHSRHADLHQALVDLIAWELLQPDIDAKMEAMQRAVKANGLWREVTSTPLPIDLFRQAAQAGLDSIDPLEATYNGAPLFGCVDRIRATMQTAANGQTTMEDNHE